MKTLIESNIVLLETLQKFPHEEMISCLRDLLINNKDNQKTINKQQTKCEISMQDGGVFANDIEIISKRAYSFQQIFRVLLDQFLEDSINGKHLAHFRLLNIHEIAEILEKKGVIILDKEKQIRNPINRLQKEILKLVKADIIENVRYSGAENPYGYRLDPKMVCFAAKTT